jgi:uncharacterized protein (DUF58 family)
MFTIVPTSRLLFWVAAVLLPMGIVTGAAAYLTPVATAGVLALLVAALVDATASRRRLAGVAVTLPPVLRVSKDRHGCLALQFTNETGRPVDTLRVALAWPREIDARTEEMTVSLPASAERSEVEWPCIPRQRGRYPIQKVFVEMPSRLGLWGMRKTVPVQNEIRVYPNLFSDRRAVAALFLNRGVFGVHARRQVGRGREFEKLREYIAGDAVDDIHWKASAKRGHPVTKVYQIERTQEVYVVVDASRLSARPAGTVQNAEGRRQNEERKMENDGRRDSTLERFIVAALILGLAAEQQGDLFGLLAFSDRVESFIPARNGKQHYGACRDALYTLQPRILSPDFEELMSFIRLRLRRRALVVFLTSLDDAVLAEQFTQSVELIARQHVVLVNMLQLDGVKPLFSDPALSSVDQLYERLAGHLRWGNLRELKKVLQRRGVQFSTLANESLSADLISQYLNVRQRQML